MRHTDVRGEDVENPVSALREKPAADKGIILVSVLSPALLVAALIHSVEPGETLVGRPGEAFASSTRAQAAFVDTAGENSGTPLFSRRSFDSNRQRALTSTEFGWEGPDLLLPHGEQTRVVHFRFEAVEIDGEILQLDSTEIVSAENRIEYRRSPLTEWYERRRNGWEQGFTIARAPAGNSLSIEMRITTTPVGSDDDAAIFHYPGAIARDADGNPIPVRVRGRGSSLALAVDVSGARYPLIVLPVVFYENERKSLLGVSGTDRSGAGH